MDVVKSDDCQSNRECCGACETGQSVKLTWGRSSSSRFFNDIWLQTLVVFVCRDQAHIKWACGRVCSGLNRPIVWRKKERAKELKGMLLLTRANQKFANEPLMHTRHTSLLRTIHYSVLWFIHVFISLSQNGTVPLLCGLRFRSATRRV